MRTATAFRRTVAGPSSPLRGRARATCHRAFSLLEVILALAILTGGIAVLGELVRLGARNAAHARDMTQAQLLCESKLAQITSGMMLPEPVVDARFDPADLIDPYDPTPWVYAIETAAVDEQGLIAVAVTVAQDLPEAQHPVRFTLVRWIPNPGLEVAEQPAPEDGASQPRAPTDVGTTETSSGGTP